MAPEKILIVDDEDLTRWALREKLSHWGYQAVEADRGTGAIEAADREFPDLILLDIRLPDRSGLEVLQIIKNKDPSVAVIVMTANGVLEDAVAALRLGAYDFVSKPIHFDTLSTTISTALKAAKRQREECHSPPRRPRGFDFRKIVGRSRGVSEAIELVKKVSITPTTPILIQGETGTGKELFAKAIHDHSIQAGRPLLMVNCAAVPERVLETELFGYEKDAFTEACGPKPGLFELIGGGTLVLDEISEVKPRLQAKLLRILEEHAFKRVGGVQDIPLELRLIASSS
ncbi:MAG: sigma-54-dependent transcriptional regulator, partial [Acidobacteriota bacterium]